MIERVISIISGIPHSHSSFGMTREEWFIRVKGSTGARPCASTWPRMDVILRSEATKNLVVRTDSYMNSENEILRAACPEPLDFARDQRLRRKVQETYGELFS
jgi:hypothetical protein